MASQVPCRDDRAGLTRIRRCHAQAKAEVPAGEPGIVQKCTMSEPSVIRPGLLVCSAAMRVVIVEDDPGVANLLRVVLERDGQDRKSVV